MKKKGRFAGQKKKRKLSQGKLHGMTISLVSNALWALLIAILLFLGILGSQSAYRFGYQVFSSDKRKVESQELTITLEENTGALSLGKELQKAGIIDDAYVFFVQSVVFDLDIQPGTYVIDRKDSSRELLEIFHKGPESSQ